MDGSLEKASFRNWLELPEDIMEVILKKLNLIDDFIRFGAVCMLWKSLCRRKRHLLPRQLPLLMTRNGRRRNAFSVFSFDMKRAYSVSVQIPRRHHCVGSSEGWLVIEAENYSSLFLFRPFSCANNKIDLPPLDRTDKRYLILRVVLSADPASSSEFTLMVVLGIEDGECLTFYRSGNPSWTKVKRMKPIVTALGGKDLNIHGQDVVYYNHQFYAVDCWGNVYTCDVSIFDPVLTDVAKYPQQLEYDKIWYCYLVELSGELLQVQRLIKDLTYEGGSDDSEGSWEIEESETLSTAGFEIFKLDMNSLKWNEVKSLGDHVLFLGWQSSMAIKTIPCSGCFSNYICFYKEKGRVYFSILSDSGFFNFQDGSIERYTFGQQPSVILIEPKMSGF